MLVTWDYSISIVKGILISLHNTVVRTCMYRLIVCLFIVEVVHPIPPHSYTDLWQCPWLSWCFPLCLHQTSSSVWGLWWQRGCCTSPVPGSASLWLWEPLHCNSTSGSGGGYVYASRQSVLPVPRSRPRVCSLNCHNEQRCGHKNSSSWQ